MNTLSSLRHELETGNAVSPILPEGSTRMPFCIYKCATGEFIQATPTPYCDIQASYRSIDELCEHHPLSCMPIWIVGESPAFQEVEKEHYRQMDQEIAKEATIQALIGPNEQINISRQKNNVSLPDF